MFRLYIIGVSILMLAIISNFIANKLSIKTWYGLFEVINEQGASGIKMLSLIDYIWLVIFYPLLLGLGYLLGSKIYHSIFN